MRIAIMQPYFMPYAGYFRLMEAVDLFVVYDCVQFPRRGWVHRNKLTHINGAQDWLTLPLAKGDRDTTRIMDLAFSPDAENEWAERLRQFPALAKDTELMQQVRHLEGTPCAYIAAGLKKACDMLGIDCRFEASSTLGLDMAVRGEDRILAITKYFGATEYINAPGGTELYDHARFAQEGITLKFLSAYNGPYTSILERLQNEPAAEIIEEIRTNCTFQAP